METEIKIVIEIECLFYSRCEIREKKDENDTSLIGGRWSTTKSTKFDRSKKGGKRDERQVGGTLTRDFELVDHPPAGVSFEFLEM